MAKPAAVKQEAKDSISDHPMASSRLHATFHPGDVPASLYSVGRSRLYFLWQHGLLGKMDVGHPHGLQCSNHDIAGYASRIIPGRRYRFRLPFKHQHRSRLLLSL